MRLKPWRSSEIGVLRYIYMSSILASKIKESCISVLPITVIIFILNLVLPDKQLGYDLAAFLIGAFLLITGMVFYSLGSEIALSPIGETIGNKVTSTKKIPLILIVGFVIGFMVTIAEPDLMVLGDQLGSIKTLLIIAIAFGVGLFLTVALGRIFAKINLNIVLIVFYAIIFILVIFVDSKYIPLAFDSGGVTTGAITVPFIMSLGVGVASVFGGKGRSEDSFGVVAICSIGPVLLVLLLCLIYTPEITIAEYGAAITSFQGLCELFLTDLISCLKEVAIAILPISIFFFVINACFLKLPKNRVMRIIFGLIYTYIGLTLFLTGVNAGFIGMGYNLGERLAALDSNIVLVPVGMVIGAFIVLAEPAVHVLCRQVEKISSGAIKSRTLLISLSVSMMISIGLATLRILYDIPVYYILIPGYAIALILSFFVPKNYTAIAFDSGGVASGPMATTFMLPLAIGAATTVSGGSGEYALLNAYGMVAFIALTPLVTIQILGLVAKIKTERKPRITQSVLRLFDKDIIELNTER